LSETEIGTKRENMSLGCYECRKLGNSFDTAILFHPDGVFDRRKTMFDFDNFYTCCLKLEDIVTAKESRFAIAVEKYPHNNSILPNRFSKLHALQRFAKISENWLKENSPRIYQGLLSGNG
jgi:hypothetical protein